MGNRPEVFDFEDEAPFLRAWVESEEKWGAISRLAKGASCERSHLSRVLAGRATLTLDQALLVAQTIGLRDLDLEYFFLLVQRTRAATPALRTFLESKLLELRHQAEDIRNRVRKPVVAPESISVDGLHYYTSKDQMAVHLATSIPGLSSEAALAKALHIPLAEVEEILKVLETLGYVENSKQGWKFRRGSIHLPKDHPLVLVHHQNWRLEALRDASRPKSSGLHFTSVQTLSQADLGQLRTDLLRWIERYAKTAEPSPPERLACLCLDFFSIGEGR